MTDLDLTRLKVAFAFHVAKMIVESDDDVDPREMSVMTDAFPRELLDGLDFVDDKDGFTDTYHDAVVSALEELPGRLTTEEKLHLVTIFARASFADGTLHEREQELLVEAAAYLGINADQVGDHLRSLMAPRG